MLENVKKNRLQTGCKVRDQKIGQNYRLTREKARTGEKNDLSQSYIETWKIASEGFLIAINQMSSLDNSTTYIKSSP